MCACTFTYTQLYPGFSHPSNMSHPKISENFPLRFQVQSELLSQWYELSASYELLERRIASYVDAYNEDAVGILERQKEGVDELHEVERAPLKVTYVHVIYT